MNSARIIVGVIWLLFAYLASNETLMMDGSVLLGIGLTDKQPLT